MWMLAAAAAPLIISKNCVHLVTLRLAPLAARHTSSSSSLRRSTTFLAAAAGRRAAGQADGVTANNGDGQKRWPEAKETTAARLERTRVAGRTLATRVTRLATVRRLQPPPSDENRDSACSHTPTLTHVDTQI